MLWILHVGGSRRQYVSGDRTCAISNGPCHLGDNFLEGYWRRRFVASSQTLSPTFHGVKLQVDCSLMI